jgi:hypothetical protein
MIPRDKLPVRVRVGEPSFIDTGCYTSHLYVVVLVGNNNHGFSIYSSVHVLLYVYINMYMYMLVFLSFTRLSLSFVSPEAVLGSQIRRQTEGSLRALRMSVICPKWWAQNQSLNKIPTWSPIAFYVSTNGDLT